MSKKRVVVKRHETYRVIVEVESENEHYVEAAKEAEKIPLEKWALLDDYSRSYNMAENEFEPVRKTK
jgi:hypothetical protein